MNTNTLPPELTRLRDIFVAENPNREDFAYAIATLVDSGFDELPKLAATLGQSELTLAKWAGGQELPTLDEQKHILQFLRDLHGETLGLPRLVRLPAGPEFLQQLCREIGLPHDGFDIDEKDVNWDEIHAQVDIIGQYVVALNSLFLQAERGMNPPAKNVSEQVGMLLIAAVELASRVPGGAKAMLEQLEKNLAKAKQN